MSNAPIHLVIDEKMAKEIEDMKRNQEAMFFAIKDMFPALFEDKPVRK